MYNENSFHIKMVKIILYPKYLKVMAYSAGLLLNTVLSLIHEFTWNTKNFYFYS